MQPKRPHAESHDSEASDSGDGYDSETASRPNRVDRARGCVAPVGVAVAFVMLLATLSMLKGETETTSRILDAVTNTVLQIAASGEGPVTRATDAGWTNGTIERPMLE